VDVFKDEKTIRRISRADVNQMQVVYRIIFGTDGAPKWMKKQLQRALNADEEDLEFTSWFAGIGDELVDG
jgi:hypothetical protein